MKIRIQLGTILEADYHVMVTTAPVAYDGFGTINLQPTYLNGKEARLVLIRDEHKSWQLNRYWSGVNAVDECPEQENPGIDERVVVEWLYERLKGGAA